MSQAALPDHIGPYRVLRPIARGGMAEVYEVEDPVSGEHLAAKLLVQTGGALPRFNREFEAMIRLNHPNIVRVYHYGRMNDSPWLTMELIAGTPIQAYAKSQGRAGSPDRTLEVMRITHDLALALDHIHRRYRCESLGLESSKGVGALRRQSQMPHHQHAAVGYATDHVCHGVPAFQFHGIDTGFLVEAHRVDDRVLDADLV